jgi:hypothetical protein
MSCPMALAQTSEEEHLQEIQPGVEEYGLFPSQFPGGPGMKYGNSEFGYIGEDLKWHKLKRIPRKIKKLKPRPLAIYENGMKVQEYTDGISQQSADRIMSYVMEPDVRRFFNVSKGKDGEYEMFYRIGPLKIKAKSQNPFDRFALKNALIGVSPKTYPQYYPKYKKLIEKLVRESRTPIYNNDLKRERVKEGQASAKGFSYSLERFKWYMQSFEKEAQGFGKKVDYHLSEPPKARCQNKDNAAYQFSLVPFKKGDLDKSCKERVDRGVQQGFSKVTMFFPIPYSGGDVVDPNEKIYNKVKKKKLRKGWDFQYEEAGKIDEAELHRCLQYVYKSGLELNFVPHLESIVTLNDHGESEWRIHGQVPLDKDYYQRAYGPLMSFLKGNKDLVKGKKVRVSVAAELDPIFIGNTNDSLLTTERVKKDLESLGLTHELSWNPNGDFYNGWDRISTAHLECKKVVTLLQKIDRIAPSLYEEYNHIQEGSFVKTREHFYKLFYKKMKTLCPKYKKQIKAAAESKKFSIGEFALAKDSKTDYSRFNQEMLQERKRTGDEGLDATFWNSGRWDDAGISRDNKGNSRGIASTLHSCKVVPVMAAPAQCEGQDPSQTIMDPQKQKAIEMIQEHLQQ